MTASEFDAIASSIDDAMRHDVRRVVDLLGETLKRLEGEELFDLVEQVRAHAKVVEESEDDTERDASAQTIRELLRDAPPATLGQLVRAFSVYFSLANVAEQVARVRGFASRPEDDGWLARAITDIVDEQGAEGLRDGIDRLHARTVFTAHPTEVSRRTVLTKLRRIADILSDPSDPESRKRRRQDADLAQLIDLVWQTDAVRRTRPTPLDEARHMVFYLQQILDEAMPALSRELADMLREHGVELAPTRAPFSFGSWIGGDRDGNPNVTPQVTRDVLDLHHRIASRIVIEQLDVLIRELSPSDELAGVSDELLESLEADREHLPDLDPRLLVVNAAEPYRLKLS